MLKCQHASRVEVKVRRTGIKIDEDRVERDKNKGHTFLTSYHHHLSS
jgi:hypothetical protein